MKYLKLTIEAILQSYGGPENVWRSRKDTHLAPTRTAIIGLIGCAMGLKQTDPRYKKLNELSFFYKDNKKVQRINDYQLIRPKEAGKSYENSFFWSSDGNHKNVQLPTYKEYLVDSSFTVYVGSNEELVLKELHQAFRDPVWPYYLGRACCTPSTPIVDKVFELHELEEGVKPCICP